MSTACNYIGFCLQLYHDVHLYAHCEMDPSELLCVPHCTARVLYKMFNFYEVVRAGIVYS